MKGPGVAVGESISAVGVFGIYFASTLIKQLFRKLQKDVNQIPDKNKPFHLKSLHHCNIVLPPLDEYPADFKERIVRLIVDEDMCRELTMREVLNWCRTAKPLLPLKTTGDGNCLLHSISLSCWGVEDTDLFLRRLMYYTLFSDESCTYKQRWLCEKKGLGSTVEGGLRLNTQEWEDEWAIVCGLGDDTRQNNPNDLPFRSLEEIHVFVMANVLRRPIIVLCETVLRSPFGTSIQENTFGGIYLPLQWNPENCCTFPIVLCYTDNHFTPLVSQSDRYHETVNSPQAEHVVPIVHHDQVPLKLHFFLPYEEAHAMTYLKDYLKVVEVPETTSDGVDMIPAAKLNTSPLPEDMNIVRDFFKLMERQYTGTGTTNESGNMTAARADIKPYQKPVGSFPLSLNLQNDLTGIKCATQGCRMAGSAETNNLCSRCFADFSRRDAEMEAAKRQAARQSSSPLIDVQPLDESRQASAGNAQRVEGRQSVEKLVATAPSLCQRPGCSKTVKPPARLCVGCYVSNEEIPSETTRQEEEPSLALKKAFLPAQYEPMETARRKVEQYLQLQQLHAPAKPPVEPSLSLSPTERSKQICSTPGCEGLRLRNPHGMCHSCYQSTLQKKVPIPNQSNAEALSLGQETPEPLEAGLRTPDSQLVESGLTNPPTGEVIVSEEQKIKCAGPMCSNKVFPPKQLCDNCVHILSQAVTQKGRCRKPGCEFHGSPEFDGYCSTCFNEAKGRNAKSASAQPRQVVAAQQQHTAPIKRNLAVAVEPRNHSAPLFSRGKHCLTTACTRYGDPAMDGYCTRCYEHTRSRAQSSGRMGQGVISHPPNSSLYEMPPSQPAAVRNKRPSSSIVPSGSGQFARGNGMYVPTGRNELVTASGNFQQNMARVEGLFKSEKCRSPGCSNFGSSAKQGYCSTCYDARRGEDVVDCVM